MKLNYETSKDGPFLTIDGIKVEQGDELLALYDAGLTTNKAVLEVMPPLRHNKDLKLSDVFSFISVCCRARDGSPIDDEKQAAPIFHSARAENCRWIVFDPIKKCWMGRDVVNPLIFFTRLMSDQSNKIAALSRELAHLKYTLGLK